MTPRARGELAQRMIAAGYVNAAEALVLGGDAGIIADNLEWIAKGQPPAWHAPELQGFLKELRGTS